MQKTAPSEHCFALARAMGLIACALLALMAFPAAPVWADEAGEEVCGYAYLERSADDSSMYNLIVQSQQRDDQAGFVYLGAVKTKPSNFRDVPWDTYRMKIREASVRGDVRPVEADWFTRCEMLTKVDLSGLDGSNLQSMYSMFAYCYLLEEVDLSMVDTSHVESFYAAFRDCTSLKRVSVRSTSSATDMMDMFYGCRSLSSLDLSAFSTSKVTGMGSMFGNCSSLEELDLASFSVENLQSSGSLFSGCSLLTSVSASPEFWAACDSGGLFEDGAVWTPAGDPSTQCCSVSDIKSYAAQTDQVITFASPERSETAIRAIANPSKDELMIRTGARELESGEVSLGIANAAAWKSIRSTIKTVAFENQVAPKVISGWFKGFSALTAVNNLDLLDVSAVGNMSDLFDGCSSLTALDCSHFDTSAAWSMDRMFSGCRSLEELDLSPSFNTERVVSMECMFQDCAALQRVDLSSFDTSRVSNMQAMFQGCSSFASFDLSRFDTSNVTSMSSMFSDCSALESFEFSGFDAGKLSTTSSMFCRCKSLKSVTFGEIDLTSVSEATDMFKNCPAFASVVVDADARFDPALLPDCIWSSSLDGESYRSKDIPVGVAATYSFVENAQPDCAYALLKDTGELVISVNMADLGAGDIYSVDLGSYTIFNTPPWYGRRAEITSATIKDATGVKHVDYWFFACSNMVSVDLSGLDATCLDSMTGMFRGCAALESVNLEPAEGAPVYTASNLFDGCSSLVDVRLPGMGNHQTMYAWYMFRNCASLASVDLSEFAAPERMKRIEAQEMFNGCARLEKVALPESLRLFRSNSMFRSCTSLTSLDLSGVTTEGATDLSEMFRGCSSLKSLDLSGFDTQQVKRMKRMFHGCRALESVTLGAGFTFRGATFARLPGSEFPSGAWQAFGGDGQPIVESEDAEKGITRVYASDSIPNLKAATYKRVADETAEGLVVESLRGDTVAGTAKYTVDTTFVKEGDAVEAVNDYRLDDSYAADSFVVGDAAKASSVKLTNTTVTKQTVGSVYSKKVSLIEIGPQVSRIKARAFENAPNVKSITVRSDKLTTKGSVYNCLFKSRVMKVHYDLTTTYTKYLKVKGAFKKWSGKKFK